MYLIEWCDEMGECHKSARVQYLPDIAEVIRKAFGEDRTQFITIERED